MTTASTLSDATSAISRAAHRMFSEFACDYAFTLGPEGQVEYANDQSRKFMVVPVKSLLFCSLLNEDCVAAAQLAIEKAYLEGPQSLPLTLRASTGAQAPIHARVFWDVATRSLWVIGHDLSKVRKVEEDLRHLATHDALTGTPNRVLLKERIDWHIHDAQRNKSGFALVAIDLDGFKKVNDALGHLAGDELLTVVATRIQACVRKVDTVSRTGGDEFVLVLANSFDVKSVQLVCLRVLDALRRPIEVQGQDVYISASIGVALYPEHGQSQAELAQHADMAMYQAKQQGKNRVSFYAPELQSVSSSQLSLEASMHSAIRNGEFLVYYQPLVTCAGVITGCEALMRWRKPDGTWVSPVDFIPVAENNGLITLLGDYVVRAAAMQLRRFDEAGLTGLYMSVNVSPRQLRHPNFEKNLEKVLKLTGIDPSRLVLEITEGILMNEQQVTQALLRKISATGIRFSLDDFGTGYSCLAYLKTYPISVLKVDRSFLQDVETDEVSRAIVQAIISLARALKLHTVVEGVETEAQAKVLKTMGADYLQGYLFGRPMPPSELIEKFGPAQLIAA
jgi:diguanylate cyclase (GGDEF)-like protein